jgi:hypothetical protein
MYSGWVAAMQEELDTILATCADSCFQEGTFMGELAAIAYCELAIALDGLGLDDLFIRGPVDVCGLTFEVGCDERFQSTGLSYFSQVQGVACGQYTRGPHLTVFRRTQHNQCAYNPLEPEEP